MSADKPLLAVSMGDPVGIGPEVLLGAIQDADLRQRMDLIAYGDLGVYKAIAARLGLSMAIREVRSPAEARQHSALGHLAVCPVSRLESTEFRFGEPGPLTDRVQFLAIQAAFQAVQSGAADALVTAPIRKAAVADVEGLSFPGHTELLAHWCGVSRPVMMLAGPHLRAVPLTIHVPIKAVPALLEGPILLETARVLDADLKRYFGLSRPRIAVTGLNPHAGENGRFGDEEARFITPRVRQLQAEGLAIEGPFPADSLFPRVVQGDFDAVIGMYHDQALIPLKLLDFDDAVNLTLGLSIIRTSVDHGTAYDIAGQGLASPRSMREALRLAAEMSLTARRQSADAEVER